MLYTNTLLPASVSVHALQKDRNVLKFLKHTPSCQKLYGFLITGCAILFSGSVGSLVDRFKAQRLRLVRFFIFSQKVFVVASYTLFYVLFQTSQLRIAAQNGGRGPDPLHARRIDVWFIFAAIALLGCFLTLCNVGVSVSIERDWVTSISKGSSRRLTRLNAIMRRIDLLSKLLAPLFVSLLTTVIGYGKSCIILLAISAGTTFFELYFIGIVFRRFSILGQEEEQHRGEARVREQHQSETNTTYPPRRNLAVKERIGTTKGLIISWSWEQYNDWKTFIAMPIFISEFVSLCVCVYVAGPSLY